MPLKDSAKEQYQCNCRTADEVAIIQAYFKALEDERSWGQVKIYSVYRRSGLSLPDFAESLVSLTDSHRKGAVFGLRSVQRDFDAEQRFPKNDPLHMTDDERRVCEAVRNRLIRNYEAKFGKKPLYGYDRWIVGRYL